LLDGEIDEMLCAEGTEDVWVIFFFGCADANV